MGLRDGHHVLELFDLSRPERELESRRSTEELLSARQNRLAWP